MLAPLLAGQVSSHFELFHTKDTNDAWGPSCPFHVTVYWYCRRRQRNFRQWPSLESQKQKTFITSSAFVIMIIKSHSPCAVGLKPLSGQTLLIIFPFCSSGGKGNDRFRFSTFYWGQFFWKTFNEALCFKLRRRTWVVLCFSNSILHWTDTAECVYLCISISGLVCDTTAVEITIFVSCSLAFIVAFLLLQMSSIHPAQIWRCLCLQ